MKQMGCQNGAKMSYKNLAETERCTYSSISAVILPGGSEGLSPFFYSSPSTDRESKLAINSKGIIARARHRLAYRRWTPR